MKKTYSIALCILLLCSLLLTVGTTMASEPGYAGITENYQGSTITVDGKWTTAAEWADAWNEHQFPSGINARFMYKMDSSVTYTMLWLVEFPDSTDDAGDMWRICIDGSLDGGTAPNANDNKLEITGHNTLKVYVGNGTGWAPMTVAGGINWKNSLTTSSYIAANHWVLEVSIDKGTAFPVWGANSPPHGLFVAMYDASNSSQGWVQWPPTSPDNPSRWGSISGFGTEIPESLSVAVVVALSSVAVIVGSIYLRKRPKTTILTPTKL